MLFPDNWMHISLLLLAGFWVSMTSVNRHDWKKNEKKKWKTICLHPGILTSRLLSSPTKYLLTEIKVFTGKYQLRSCCIQRSFYSGNFTEARNEIVAATETHNLLHET